MKNQNRIFILGNEWIEKIVLTIALRCFNRILIL